MIAVVVIAVMIAPVSSVSAGPTFSEWSLPRNLGPIINSGVADTGPATSKDGLRLYFGSSRAGGFGSFDIYVSRRPTVAAPWGPPVNLGPTVNTPSIENIPCLSRDEHTMYFTSTRPGGFGDRDVWASYRDHTNADFGWQAPVNLGPNVNTAYWDGGGCTVENDDVGPRLLYFNSNRPGGLGSFDIYVSAEQLDGSFGPAKPVTEVSSPADDRIPRIRFDGLEMFLLSSRSGGFGDLDVWVSTRRSTSEPWGAPVNLGPTVNGPYIDDQAYPASDRMTLYFVSTRPGGSGTWDLYVTTRIREPARK